MYGKTRTLFLLAMLTATAVAAAAQIGSDPDVVYIRVSASDSQGRFVTGLKAEAIKIAEDKVPQQIATFSGDMPISVAIMLDVRGTMKEDLKTTATSFFMPGSSPADQFFLLETNDRPLNEAVFEGLNTLIRRGTNPIRAFVLITDRKFPGATSFSRVKEVLKDQDVEFFAVGTSDLGDLSPGEGQYLWRDLATMSGGQAFFPTLAVQVEAICKTIAVDLRHQYVIGYRPTNLVKDGKWRKTTVTATITDPATKRVRPLTVRVKPGYYAPTVATTPAKN